MARAPRRAGVSRAPTHPPPPLARARHPPPPVAPRAVAALLHTRAAPPPPAGIKKPQNNRHRSLTGVDPKVRKNSRFALKGMKRKASKDSE